MGWSLGLVDVNAVCVWICYKREREREWICALVKKKMGMVGGCYHSSIMEMSQMNISKTKLKGKECEIETIQKSKRNRRERRAGVTLIYQKKKKKSHLGYFY
jgi:hypothetical protein